METHILSRTFILVLCIYSLKTSVHGAGECGRNNPDKEAIKLAPCAMAAQDKSAKVSPTCCVRIKQMGKNPKCLCAVMLSSTARSSGAKPEISMTIPNAATSLIIPLATNVELILCLEAAYRATEMFIKPSLKYRKFTGFQ